MQATQGSLTVINPQDSDPKVFWNGRAVQGIKRIHIHNDEDESRVKLVVTGTDDEIYAQMIVAGINVKKVAA